MNIDIPSILFQEACFWRMSTLSLMQILIESSTKPTGMVFDATSSTSAFSYMSSKTDIDLWHMALHLEMVFFPHF